MNIGTTFRSAVWHDEGVLDRLDLSSADPEPST
jgi:hypothetical protein